ncbi:hypothetical protein BD779DRAFT_1802782 [Infundibulicybe gibba]|nr:hypothetical protein BD779DRAFT_1802782 [Infundibulicybe gibba]
MDLPPEIIQIVFLEVCSSKTVFPLQRDEPRLLITRVCSQWRAIALALPSLWANIEFPLDSPPPLDPFRMWISRSAQSTLSFEIRAPNANNHDASSTAIVDLIFPIIQRCASLKLYMDEPTFTRLLSLPPGSLRALQEISITPAPTLCSTTFSTIPRATAFHQCPQLHRVKLAFRSRTTDFSLPWHQLTHLDMYQCGIGISTFSTPFHDLQRMEALSHHPIALPSLHTLHLRLSDRAGLSIHFFHALRLPFLRSLGVALPGMRLAMLPVFRALLSKTIRHLDFPSWTPMDLPSVLAFAPNLEVLKLRDGPNLRMLEMLGCGALPRLATLKFGPVYSHDLFDMLEARVDAARSDSSMTVLNDVLAVAEDEVWNIAMGKTRLVALRAAGIQVVFSNWPYYYSV